MTSIVPPNVERLVSYVPGKPIEELERELGIHDAIKLASNENPLGPSPGVREAVTRAASNVHFYPDASAFALRRDLAAHHRVSMDEVCVGNGSNDLIDLISRTFAAPSDHAVLGNPSFVCYRLGCIAANVSMSEVPLKGHLEWDVDALLDAVRPNTRLLFLANPNNPTGAYVGRGELARLVRSLPSHVLLVVDEAYVEFADAPDYVSALALRSERKSLITLRTFSKAYGLAGLRVGYGIAPTKIVEYLNRVRPPFNVNAVGQIAARAALADPAHVARYVAINAAERVRLRREFESMGLRVAPSQANFVLVDFGRAGAQVYDALLRRAVIVRPMAPPIDTWQRITVGLPEQNARLLTAVREVLQS